MTVTLCVDSFTRNLFADGSLSRLPRTFTIWTAVFHAGAPSKNSNLRYVLAAVLVFVGLKEVWLDH
jgi:hypothetical protein